MLRIMLQKKLLIGIFVFLYLIIFFFSLFFEINTILTLRTKNLDSQGYNIIPFHTINDYIINFYHFNISTWLYNFLGNIILYTPLGILLPLFFTKVVGYRYVFLISLFISLIIETFQYLTSFGVFDIDDIILNITGSLIGYFIFEKILKV